MFFIPYIQDFWPKWLSLSKLVRIKEVTEKQVAKIACREGSDPIGIGNCRKNAEAAYVLLGTVGPCGRRKKDKERNALKTGKVWIKFCLILNTKFTKERQIQEIGFNACRNTF